MTLARVQGQGTWLSISNYFIFRTKSYLHSWNLRMIRRILHHRSQAGMTWGSPICNFSLNILISLHTTARHLGISPSKIHNIIKSFRFQGWKPTLDACNLQALRWHCFKNGHHCITDIITWTRETLKKTVVGKYSLSLHLQAQAMYQEHPETLLTSLRLTSSEMDWWIESDEGQMSPNLGQSTKF